MKGFIFDIKHFAIHDGPGIRVNVFLKGCPLHCLWCHNPEGVSFKPELMLMPNRCARCGDCIRACRYGALSQKAEGLVVADREKCVLCGDCVMACSRQAIEIAGREWSVEEVVAEVEKDRIFFEQSGGGVTLTGGEPMAQPQFVESLLEAFRQRGLHTALDTSGYGPEEILLRLTDMADLILFDLKIMDDKKHKEYTGVSNRFILSNLKALDNLGKPVWIRWPLIPGVNDDEANLASMVDFLLGLKSVQMINVLPYHKGGVEKFRRLGREKEFAIFDPPDPEKVDKAVDYFKKKGFKVKRGG